jgi:hypothetical protein
MLRGWPTSSPSRGGAGIDALGSAAPLSPKRLHMTESNHPTWRPYLDYLENLARERAEPVRDIYHDWTRQEQLRDQAGLNEQEVERRESA